MTLRSWRAKRVEEEANAKASQWGLTFGLESLQLSLLYTNHHVLQWGHDLAVMESGHRIRTEMVHRPPLQWGHDLAVMERSFCGASADQSLPCFNGAMTLRSWRARAGRYRSVPLRWLQWGHDLAVMERCKVPGFNPRCKRFNGAMTLRSWRDRARTETTQDYNGFNGAMTLRSWRAARQDVECASTVASMGPMTLRSWREYRTTKSNPIQTQRSKVVGASIQI